MSQISTWYNNHSGAFRSTRLRAPSLVPSNRVAVNQQTLVVDGRNQGTGAGTGTADAPGKDGQAAKRRETIFGPDVGEDDEPGWTSPDDGVKVGVDTVRGWVERAKAEEGLHATTTLQALVNLKRPTLQLLQLDAAPDPRVAIRRDLASIPAGTVLATPENGTQDATRSMSTSTHLGVDDINPALRSMSMSSAFSTGSGMSIPSAPLHLIKFAYDATAPSVRITLTIHPRLSTAPAVEGKESIHEEEQAEAVKTVYTGLHPGGFNQAFQLPHSAAMDLSSAVAPMPPAGSEEDDDKKNLSGGAGVRGANSEDTTRTSYERGMSNMSTTLATVPEVDGGNGTDANGNDTNAGVGGRVRNLFGRRRRENDVEQGNIEMEERNAEAAKGGEEEQKEEKGMRVLIRIEGVGAEGEPLSRRNAQLTHILVTGMWVADNTASTAAVDEQAPVPANTGKRVWVVKVVRREAIIGAHTFLLKEIYGLSTAASATSATPSYPPTADATDPYASTPNECIVCLTSPRDVVLLPCRHLVVCRECAVGMVEFGAGGKVARRDGEGDDTADGTTGASAGTDGTAAAAPTGPAPAVAGGTTTGGRERRKKKAKGWYCPVCRQPYTSLLRLALPEVGGGEATEEAAHEHAHAHTDADADGLSLNRTRSRGAASIKSHRTGRQSLYLHKVGSRATLPDGAERMLEALRPDADSESDEDEYEVGNNGSGNANGNGTGEGRSRAHGGFDGVVPESERPQFVLGDEVDLDDKAGNASANGGKAKGKENEEDQKAEVEHREVADWQAQHAAAESAPGRTSEDGKKGWKEV